MVFWACRIPDYHWSEFPCALITLKAGHDDLSEDEIILFETAPRGWYRFDSQRLRD
ncbi:hypothetical protein SAMN02745729_13310 [Marinobacterium iners DSM 11526]|uniref:Uncharacterized protein n=1 Tax=Marinobacterium iners DSM 11526 TaxID=1122198 RepID=A0A1H4HAY2_9GAMM|nr:hypothetical protein SAMN02745729_13310 [Marinobacterium iners DSM 11526]